MKLLKLFVIILLPMMSSCLLFSNEKKIIKTSFSKSQFTPIILWSIAIGSNIGNFYSNLHPAFAKGIVYAADRKGNVHAFNIEDGKKVWSVNLAKKNNWLFYNSAMLSSGITIANGHVYIGSEKAQVYALNIHNGSIIWQTSVAGEVLANPVVSNGMVLIHTSNGYFQALNERDGIVQWTISLNNNMPYLSMRGESSPATALGIAVIGSDSGYIKAVLIKRGQIIWQQRIFTVITPNKTNVSYINDVDTTPIIIDSIVYTLTYNGKIVALDLFSGRIIWERNLECALSDFIINGNTIYLLDHNDRLLSLSIENGETIWTQDNLLHCLLTSPVLDNDSLVVGDSKGYIYWINLKMGSIIAYKKINNSGFLTNPILVNDKLIIQTKNGKLYVIKH